MAATMAAAAKLLVLLGAVLPPASTSGWGPWSPWAPCSRSCGEGLQARRRLCLSSLSGCEGGEVSWRACGLLPCPADTSSWRDEQCSLHNNRALEGEYHLWRGAELPESPCSLDCRAEGQEGGLLHRFLDRVEDGTRCGQGGLALCLAGECEEVGCDLQLQSGEVLDQCGVCGGDGSSCKGGRYVWHQELLSRCSSSCGGGERMVQQLCREESTQDTVDQGLCDGQTRPNTSFVACNQHPCPARWEMSEWSLCSSPCSGLRRRSVQCVSDREGARLELPHSSCPASRPASQEACTGRDCPVWYTGTWSGCSASCGPGVQSRRVECRNTSGTASPVSSCGGARPPDTQDCQGQCREAPRAGGVTEGWSRLEEDGAGEEQEEWREEGAETALDHTVEQAPEVEDLLVRVAQPNPNFITDQWSPCSASCGEGIRFRKVSCKIFLEFSKTVATLPDRECPGLKPPETEICVERPSCGSEQVLADTVSIVSDTLVRGEQLGPEILPLMDSQEKAVDQAAGPLEPSYTWKIAGFTTCTASCLGGLQESIVICVESRAENPVAPYFCDPHQRLEIEVRTCNENPCPPRWNVSDFSDCSKSCGGGIQTRSVQCIQEVAHGGHNIISLSLASCPQPPPRSQQFCSVTDCPVQWQASPWTKCSRKCGGGERLRKVRCQQLLSLGQVIDKPEEQCQGDKPGKEEGCNTQDCVYSDTPEIKANLDQDYMQTDPYLKVLKLKVGGRATVYVGTTVKVRCPVKQYDKAAITWAKGDLIFHSGRKRARHSKVSVSGKGGLKIKTIGFKDSGVYACMAAKSTAKLEVFVKGIESHMITTEESTSKKKETIWGEKSSDLSKDLKHDQGSVDTHRYNKGKTTSHSANSLEGNSFPFEEKPPRREKWNVHREDHMEDFVYWDTIGGHVDDQARVSTDKQPEEFSQITGGACKVKISLLLIASILVIQVLTFVPWDHKTVRKPLRSRLRKKKQRRSRKKDLGASSEHSLSWSPGAWSLCSRSCGGGERRRRLSCSIHFPDRNTTQQVSASFCKKVDLRRPRRVEECGAEQCPAWRRSPWAPCGRAECMSRDTGLRTRSVRCIQERRVVSATLCETAERPGDSQPCLNSQCQGVWVLGEWSQCSASCDSGSQERSVSCEWLAGGIAPAHECAAQESRPAATIQCFGPPCRRARGPQPSIQARPSRDGREAAPCQDTSKFCGLVRRGSMCRAERLREQCCWTCGGL